MSDIEVLGYCDVSDVPDDFMPRVVDLLPKIINKVASLSEDDIDMFLLLLEDTIDSFTVTD